MMWKDEANKFLIENICSELDIPDDIRRIGVEEMLPIGGLAMVFCFFLLRGIRKEADADQYEREMTELHSKTALDEKERNEWYQKKYEQLKNESALAKRIAELIEESRSRNQQRMKNALEAINRFNNSVPKGPSLS